MDRNEEKMYAKTSRCTGILKDEAMQIGDKQRRTNDEGIYISIIRQTIRRLESIAPMY